MEYLGNCASCGEMGRGEALKRGFPVQFVSWGMIARSLDQGRSLGWAGIPGGLGVGMLVHQRPQFGDPLWPAD
jgi:hypothetical protein